ncbi:ovostatin-like [Chroicocephalus ridibundus]|uniref:ovostatin-like n=1 Tax=Chroicocephalus ridibundus TaxID=1192867 RepID=UPI002FDE1BFD
MNCFLGRELTSFFCLPVRKMWLKFLLAILLLHVTAAKEPEPQYVLMVPAVLQSDSPGQVCLQFLNLKETISVRVILEYGAVNTTIFEKTMTASNGLQCFNFTIPSVNSSPLAFISFSAKGTTVSLEERRSVMIWNTESIVFVQTDKPIYKPGQSVMFRVVALDFNFKPVQEMYPSIAIQDPRGNRIFQWQNVTSEINIIQIEFPLTEEPILGNYKIIVAKKSGDKTNHSFLVEEYVLPKFDVTVTAPESLTVLDSEFTVKVCGVYTYGQPVEGKVQLSVCRDFDSYGRCKKSPVCQSFTKDLDTDGCLSQVFSSNIFELNRIGYMRNLDVKAIVTEKGTGLQLTATQSISITRVMSSTQFENMDRHYRRGIPYFGQIKLVDKDNSPISSEVIQLFVNNKNTNNFTTDDNGIAEFSIDTSEMFDPEISLRATYKTSDHCHSEGWIEPSYPDASLSIQRFYSWTSSFVRIEPLWKDLSCGQKRMITVHYVLNTEGYESINTMNFYYVVSVGFLHGLLKGLDRAAIWQFIHSNDSRACSSWFWITSQHNGKQPKDRNSTEVVWQNYPLRKNDPHFWPCNSISYDKGPSSSSSSGSIHRALRLIFNHLKPSQCTCLDRPVDGMAKGKIVLTGEIKVNIQADQNSNFTIPLVVNEKMAPALRLLVYTLHPAKELVADSVRFPVEKCFKNKVQLQFSEKQMRSASNVSLVIEAAANSFCAVRAVDQSVLLLKSETELSAETIYSLHPLQDFQGYIFNGLNLEDDPQDPCVSSDNIFHKGLYYTPVMSGLGPDVYQFLRDMGMKFFTNSKVRQPVVCSSETARPTQYFLNAGFMASTHHVKSSAEVAREERGKRLILETIREFFPETWIWDIVLINSTGKASISYTVPDTITEWKASAFCVEELVGFGMSVPATLAVFQPFFVDLTLPYSIIRGEDFLLRANVFNYLDHCIKINISLSDSLDYQAKLISPEDDGCVCAKQRKTYVWNIFPKKIGNVVFSITAETKDDGACGGKAPRNISIDYRDTQIRTLLVEPEGIRREKTQNSLICTKDDVVFQDVALDLPTNVVEGSARASFSVVGDIMGAAMQNVHQLLQMPFGCGEQNMVLFAPNIYVLDYLNKTGQLSEEVKSKAIGYLVSGYQKQLSYKHPDGSYSIFGTRDKEGNTWLTAFVYKSFAQASHFIYIDDNVQAQTLMWLASKQKPDGCFRSVGTLFNNALKGGVNDELSLSAYITIAMLEAGHSGSYPVVRNAFFCLKTASEKSISDIYTQALMAYAFCLAGKAEKCESFLRELQKSAKEADGSQHWEQKERSPSEKSPSFLDHAPSAEVEITSYVLLAMLYKPNRSQEDLTKASGIVQWIIRQQNPYGGFSSTQDTVIALQALSAYGEATYNSVTQNVVKIASKKPFEKVIIVNNANRLLLQETPLPEVPGKYSLTVNGSGCVLMQTALRYNIHLPEGAFGFSLSVKASHASCPLDRPAKFDIVLITQQQAHVIRSSLPMLHEARSRELMFASPGMVQTDRGFCRFSYTGKRSSSNMVIIDVKMLSGFVPVKSSLDKLIDSHTVMQVENKKNHVLLYLQNISQKKRKEITFSVEQDFVVTHPKPAPVQIYDYYETEKYAVAQYMSPCKEDVAEMD